MVVDKREITILRIDLNMLRGDRIRSRRDFVEGDSRIAELNEGDVISALDEDGDSYVAVVERVKDMLVYLRLDLDSRTSGVNWKTASTPKSYSDIMDLRYDPDTEER